MNSLVAASRRATVTALRRAPTPVSAAAATATASVSATTVAQGGVIGVGVMTRGVHSPVLKTAYNTLWKRTPVYVTYIVVGCIVLEFVYGKVGDAIFDSINQGKQYKDIDWSKFAEEEDEEEEEEEEDDDE